jgi:hypothetical protein
MGQRSDGATQTDDTARKARPSPTPARSEEVTMSAEDDVRAAAERFYTALNGVLNGDAGPMADVWSQTADATAMHPIGGR